MNAELTLLVLLRRAGAFVESMGRFVPPPASRTMDEEQGPSREPEPPFWTYFLENPRPNSSERETKK